MYDLSFRRERKSLSMSLVGHEVSSTKAGLPKITLLQALEMSYLVIRNITQLIGSRAHIKEEHFGNCNRSCISWNLAGQQTVDDATGRNLTTRASEEQAQRYMPRSGTQGHRSEQGYPGRVTTAMGISEAARTHTSICTIVHGLDQKRWARRWEGTESGSGDREVDIWLCQARRLPLS
ncbi:hypothetical protein BDZ85DRAFT_267474 [Elsinoe ampelina]|uniref:Uncharacterized protein n=1 Tax=Elsinoe ampelina TaxID=302913 RepID=A0A6A6G417_9PEZI|nr:hypothetical protein BDZ85DRAFT_267474 [Elsinoe ampelina]